MEKDVWGFISSCAVTVVYKRQCFRTGANILLILQLFYYCVRKVQEITSYNTEFI